MTSPSTPAPTTGARPWERRPDESPEAWAAFCVYRDLSPRERSLSRVADAVCAPREDGEPRTADTVPGHIKDWCSAYDWVPRSGAYWQHIDDEQQRAFLAERRAIARRHARLAEDLQRHGAHVLKKLQAAGRGLSHGAAVRALVDGIKLERQAVGLTDQLLEVRHADADGSPLGHASRDAERAWFTDVLALYLQLDPEGLAALEARLGDGTGDTPAEDE